jgi:hypothetical protein
MKNSTSILFHLPPPPTDLQNDQPDSFPKKYKTMPGPTPARRMKTPSGKPPTLGLNSPPEHQKDENEETVPKLAGTVSMKKTRDGLDYAISSLLPFY